MPTIPAILRCLVALAILMLAGMFAGCGDSEKVSEQAADQQSDRAERDVTAADTTEEMEEELPITKSMPEFNIEWTEVAKNKNIVLALTDNTDQMSLTEIGRHIRDERGRPRCLVYFYNDVPDSVHIGLPLEWEMNRYWFAQYEYNETAKLEKVTFIGEKWKP